MTAQTIGTIEWRIQAVGTGVLSDSLPIDLGTLTAEIGKDGSGVVFEDGFVERLHLALAAFRAVMNERVSDLGREWNSRDPFSCRDAWHYNEYPGDRCPRCGSPEADRPIL